LLGREVSYHDTFLSKNVWEYEMFKTEVLQLVFEEKIELISDLKVN
jgi:hypothetical protein